VIAAKVPMAMSIADGPARRRLAKARVLPVSGVRFFIRIGPF
jgi:hypothetical protein